MASVAGRRIIEQKETLGGERKRFSCRLLALAPGEAVILYVLRRAGRVADLALPRGMRTVSPSE